MRKLILVFMFFSIVGCDEKFVSLEKNGAFTRTAHMSLGVLRWEGGNTFLRYAEFCNQLTKECFYSGTDKGPRWARELAYGFTYSRSKKYAAIFSNHRNKKKISGKELSIFELETGVEIPCEGCSIRTVFPPEDTVWGSFYYQDDLILESEEPSVDTIKYVFQKAKISGESYKIEPLTSFVESTSINVYLEGINENGDLEAQKCKGTCWLWTKDLETGEEKEYPNKCTSLFSLEWKDGVPVMHC